MDLDLRLVRYFTAVAEHGNIGQAAAALHITQPSLSRQIRGLEHQIGVQLFTRDAHGSRLTPAGEKFRPLALDLLARAGDAVRAVAPRGVTIGYTTNLVVTPVVRSLRRRHPDATIGTLHLGWNEGRSALLDHRADAVVAREPIDADRLDLTVLYDEPRMLLVPVDHRFAGKESVTLDDIAGEPLPRTPDPVWNAYSRIDPRPDGSPAPDGPLVDNLEDKLEIVAGGEAVAIVASGLLNGRLRPDLAMVPLEDVSPVHIVLATRAGDRNPLLPDVREAMLALRPGASSRGVRRS